MYLCFIPGMPLTNINSDWMSNASSGLCINLFILIMLFTYAGPLFCILGCNIYVDPLFRILGCNEGELALN